MFQIVGYSCSHHLFVTFEITREICNSDHFGNDKFPELKKFYCNDFIVILDNI